MQLVTNAVTHFEVLKMCLKIISPLLKKITIYIDIKLLSSPKGECFKKDKKKHLRAGFQMDLN